LPNCCKKDMADIPQSLYEAIRIENRLVMLYFTCKVVFQ